MKEFNIENQYEKLYWSKNQLVLGIDEAGRGPIAGPLVVACCVLPINYKNPYIYDSKSISLKQREYLFELIKNEAVYYSIEIVDEATIDKLNIYQATKAAMSKLALSYDCQNILTDAMKLDIDKNVIDLVKGDTKSINIAAASILAKVTRDHIMDELDKEYPGYGLSKHKGYPTKQHIEKLNELGVTPIHRLSYGPVKKLIEPDITLF